MPGEPQKQAKFWKSYQTLTLPELIWSQSLGPMSIVAANPSVRLGFGGVNRSAGLAETCGIFSDSPRG